MGELLGQKYHSVSFIARHEPYNYFHYYILSFHGVWAVACWLLFLLQWIRSKGTWSHRLMGRWILFAFLIPLEVTGLLLCPYLFLDIPRDNILLSSGHLVVPSMGFLFLITTYNTFTILHSRYLTIIMKYIGYINRLLQLVGSSALCYKILWSIDQGIELENSVELFLLTAPFTLIELHLARINYRFGHVFYAKYLTLQMFPGSMIVLARDNYWIWNEHGIDNVLFRIVIENLLMFPFFHIICADILKVRKE